MTGRRVDFLNGLYTANADCNPTYFHGLLGAELRRRELLRS